MTIPGALVECVPNFSEGQSVRRVEQIVAAMAVEGVRLLDYSLDRDHNRSVVTIAGPPEAVLESAVRGVGRAAGLIDLTRQTGEHPRIGAADVVPFVPVSGISLAQCAVLARQAGMQIWRRYGVPVYFYGAAATRPDRAELESLRRGQFEGLRDVVLRDSSRRPDVGGPELHATAGASVVGARAFLIAYNVYLAPAPGSPVVGRVADGPVGSRAAAPGSFRGSVKLAAVKPRAVRAIETAGPDIAAARAIARDLRASSGGLLGVKAIGVTINGRAQVSINVTDFQRTPMSQVHARLHALAAKHGVTIGDGELIGLVPEAAIGVDARWTEEIPGFDPAAKILEQRLMQPIRWPMDAAGG